MILQVLGLLILTYLFSGAALAGEKSPLIASFTLAVLGDIYEFSEADGRGGGFARLAAAIKAERASGRKVIVAHTGDTISPSLSSAFDQGAHIIELTNRLSPDVFVPGNHEFDYGPEIFLKRMREASFSVLAANLTEPSGRQPDGIGRHRIFDIGGVKVAVIGLTADDAPAKSKPGPLKIAPVVQTLRESAPALRADGADLVVGVVHANRREDLRLYLAGDADVILSGDDHDLAVLYNGKTAFAEAMSDGRILVAVDVEVTKRFADGKSRVDWRPRFRIIDTADVQPDPDIAQQIARYEANLSKELEVEVGQTVTALDSSTSLVRSQETAIGNLVADALRYASGAEVAVMNGGGIRGNSRRPAGSMLTRRDIYRELPFSNKVVTVRLSGADLKAALENGLTFVPRPDGRYPQVSGLKITARADGMPGNRIETVLVGTEPLDPARMYMVTTNDFIASGKEGYGVFANAERTVSEAEGPLVSKVVMDYIAAKGTVSPAIEGRLHLK